MQSRFPSLTQLTSSVLVVGLGAALFGCDASGDRFRPQVSDVPAVQDLGVLPTDEVVYGQIGASADPTIISGATFQIVGTGGPICIVVDPEAVYWSQSMSPGASSRNDYLYFDRVNDDGDLDLDVGLTAYYTGSPNVQLGDFKATYTDDLGQDHTLEFNECIQYNAFGEPAHAGRANVEFCTIDTDQRAGVLFTAQLKGFSLPIDDSILNYAVLVLPLEEGESCESALSPDECTLPDEVNLGGAEDKDSLFPDLEAAYCESSPNSLNDFCEEHLNDENPPCTEGARSDY